MSNIDFYNHPDYDASQMTWRELQDFFEGDKAKLVHNQNYLWPHEFETRSDGRDMRQRRQRGTSYFNLTRMIVSRYISLIFRNDIDLTPIEPLFKRNGEDWSKDVDGQGNDLMSFIKNKVAMHYFLFGKAGILTDSNNILTHTKGEAIEKGLRPYFELIHPLELVDWAQETNEPGRRGLYNWIRCEYDLLVPRETPVQQPKKFRYSKVLSIQEGAYTVTYFRGPEVGKLAQPTEEETWTQDGDPIVINDMTEIPVAIHEGESWVSPVLPLLVNLFNKESSLDNILHYQTYQRIIGIGTFNKKDNQIVANEGAWALLNGEGTLQVIEPVAPTSLEDRIGQLQRQIIQLAFNAQRALPSDSKEMPGPEAMAREKEDFIHMARSAAKDIEDTVNKAIKDWAAFLSIDNFEEEISIDTDIAVDDLNEQLQLMQQFMDRIRRRPAWSKGVDKWAAKQMNLENEEEVVDEIENAPTALDVESRPDRIREILINGRRRQTETEDTTGEPDQG